MVLIGLVSWYFALFVGAAQLLVGCGLVSMVGFWVVFWVGAVFLALAWAGCGLAFVLFRAVFLGLDLVLAGVRGVFPSGLVNLASACSDEWGVCG